MTFCILEAHGTFEHVPGTALLEEDASSQAAHLKKGSGKNADVVLIPQPSNDPNDPLNWPLWQRDLVLLLLCYCTNLCVGGVGPLISTITVPILKEFHTDYQKVSLLTGYQLCVVAAIAPVVSALSRKYGKRPVFLASMVFLFAGSLWCSAANSYDSLLGARLIQGVGTATFESVTFAVIGDLYFVHERGLRVALYITSQVGMVLLPSLITGVIAVHLDWRWCFGLVSIFIGIGSGLIVLFGWETAYKRSEVYNAETPATDNLELVESIKGSASCSGTSEVDLVRKTITASSAGNQRRDSLIQRMRPWSRVYDDQSLVKMMIRPFYLLLNPAIAWAMVINAFVQLWNVVISFLLAQLFASPPYSLDTAELGYLSGGPIVAGVLGCLACGFLSDRIVKVVSQRNNGVFEPEFRLLLMIFAPIFSTIGYFLFGYFAAQGRSPVLISVIWGIAFVSAQFIGNATGGYLVDAYRDADIEVFIASMSIKNFLFFGFSFFQNNWLAKWGPVKVFNCIGGVMLGLCVTTIPVYVYGKRIRAWWHTHDVFSDRHTA